MYIHVHLRYLWLHQSELEKGSRVLELGAGTALPGLLLAKLGHQVTLSDSLVLPHTLDNCREAAKCNDLQEKVQVRKNLCYLPIDESGWLMANALANGDALILLIFT